MKRILLATAFLVLMVGFLAACGKVESQSSDDVLTWTLATARVDGAALPVSEIKETFIAWGPSGGPYTTGTVSVAAPITTVSVVRGTAPGTRCYIARTVDTALRMSAESGQVCKTIVAIPNAPTGLTVR